MKHLPFFTHPHVDDAVVQQRRRFLMGVGAAALWLDEALPIWKLSAAGLVISGLALNLLWPQLRNRLRARAPNQ